MAKTKNEARSQAEGVVLRFSGAAAALGWMPGSSVFLGGAQYKMIADVARCYEVHSYDAQAIMTVIASCFAGHVASDAILSWIPVLGWAAKSATAAAVTGTAGKLVIDHFHKLSNLPG